MKETFIQGILAGCLIGLGGCSLLAISSFILCGFEHCIADMFYLFVASENVFPLLNQIAFIGVVTIGNSLGGLLSHYTYKVSSL